MKFTPNLLFVAGVVCTAGCLQVPDGLPGADAGINASGTFDAGDVVAPDTPAEDTDLGALDARDAAPPRTPFVGVTTGDTHACAWTDEGRVLCWGSSFFGQVGPTEQRELPPTWLDTPLRFQVVNAGPTATCGITFDGELACWGDNSQKVIADTQDTKVAPVLVDLSAVTANPLTAVEVGAHAICIRAGSAFCWGQNGGGVVQPGGDTNAFVEPVNRGSNIDIFLSGDFACSINDMGTLRCWGTNHQLRVDPSAPNGVLLSERSPLAERVSDVGLGALHTCALLRSGGVRCWGSSGGHRLGKDFTEIEGSISDVPGLSDMQSVAARNHACALGADGSVSCWGPTPLGEELRTLVTGDGTPFEQIDVGSQFTCGLSSSGVWCWGVNQSAQSGQPVNADNEPRMVLEPTLIALP